MAERAAKAAVPRHSYRGPAVSTKLPAGVHLPRRDQVLTEAIRLFDERGYSSVGMTDIGEAAGIVASGVYRHFPSKAGLLLAAVNRGQERLRSGTESALAQAKDAPQLLELLVRNHVDVSIEHPHVVGILATEVNHLHDKDRPEGLTTIAERHHRRHRRDARRLRGRC